MDRLAAAKLRPAPSRSIIVEPPKDVTHPAPRAPKDLRKLRMEEQWDVDSLDALRGYAPLSRDATTARELDWQHLKHESARDVLKRSDTADSSDVTESLQSTPEVGERDRRVSVCCVRVVKHGILTYIQSRHHISYRGDSGAAYEDDVRDAERYLNRTNPTARSPSRSPSRSPVRHVRSHAPSNLPGNPGHSQRYEHYAYVEPASSSEESAAETSKSTRIRHQTAKQRRSAPPRITPSDMVLTHTKQENDTLREMLDELEALRVENERLRHRSGETSVPSQPAVLAYTSKVFYQVGSTLYLDEPRWEPAEGSGVVLLANNPIRKIEYYLDQHPEIAFAIYKEYKQTPPSDRSKIETKDGVYRSPTPAHEFLSIIAPDMLDAVEELVQQIPKFGDYFPYFDPEGQILAPYLFMYYSAPFIPEVLPNLDVPSQKLIRQLQAAIEKSYGYEYDSAKMQAEKGRVARKHIKYLIRPGDVLVRNESGGNIPQACIATGWIERPETVLEESQYEESDYIQKKRIPRYGPLANSASSRKLTTYVWEVPMWYWLFDGTFAKQESRVDIIMSLGYEEESIRIQELNVYPLQYASDEVRSLLEKRGRTFWSLRNRRFVSYMRSKDDELYNVGLHH
jgi:hypothetical protein